MPKQVVKNTTAVHHEPGANGPGGDWLDQQPSFSSPTEGASQDENDSTIDLKHNELKGLHSSGKSVAPDAVSDAARPLSKRRLTTSGGAEVASTAGTEASHQRDYDNAGVDRFPRVTQRTEKEKH